MGFSIGKILVLVVIIAAVWYGFKAFGRIKQKREREEDAVEGGGTNRADADELTQCPKCGAYIAQSESHSCDASV